MSLSDATLMRLSRYLGLYVPLLQREALHGDTG
jgi:hypothetical protein